MSITRVRATTTLAAVLAIAVPSIFTPAISLAQDGAAQSRPAPVRFDLSFRGGTVAEYVAAIRKASPGADIVVTDERAVGVQIPAVQLTAVDVRAAMMLLDLSPTAGEFEIDVSPIRLEDGSDAVYVVSATDKRVRIPGTRIWSVARPLALDISAEAVLSAVEAALDVSGADATVRFHPDTALLIVKAPHDALDVVERALNEMANSAEDLRADRRNTDEEIDALAYQLAEAEGEARIAGEEMRLAAMELDWIEDAPEGILTERDAIRQKSIIQLSVIEAETRLDLARRKADLIRTQIRRLKGETDG